MEPDTMAISIKIAVLGVGMKQLMWAGIAVLLSGLVACSSTKQAADVTDAREHGVITQGIGTGASFDSNQGTGEVYTTKAPHNQVYLYAFDNSVLAKKYRPSLSAQARYLLMHPGARVVLAGHTDSRGSREYNIALGERRARSVYDLLRLDGVTKRQIRLVSYGEERPVAFSHDEDSYRLNRRVELTYEALR